MIKTFRSKALADLFTSGMSRKIQAKFHARIIVRLDALEAAAAVEELNQPGFDFHKLHGKPVRYSIHVNGPWTITFEWTDGAERVDFEQYH